LMNDAFIKRAKGPEVLRSRLDEALSIRARRRSEAPAVAANGSDAIHSINSTTTKLSTSPPPESAEEYFSRPQTGTTVYTADTLQGELAKQAEAMQPLSAVTTPPLPSSGSALAGRSKPPGIAASTVPPSVSGSLSPRAGGATVSLKEMETFKELMLAEMTVQIEAVRTEMLTLLNREVDIRERKQRQLEAELDLLRRQLSAKPF